MLDSWKPTVAGILIIVAGCYMIFFMAPVLAIGGYMYPYAWKVTIFQILALSLVIIGIFGIVSGVFAFKRKRWKIAVAGSFCAALINLIVFALDRMVLSVGLKWVFSTIVELSPAVLLIFTLILIILSRGEFE